MIEVELKYPVSSLETIRAQLLALGACSVSVSDQSDEYWNDPLRDFSELDIALRIRSFDDNYLLTFKGPNLDPVAKIRQEVETELKNELSAKHVKQIWEGIGLRAVATVAKRREELELNWQGNNVHVCLDEVAEVGCFVELERVLEDSGNRSTAKQALQELATELGLTGAIRTSYLELLLRNRGQR